MATSVSAETVSATNASPYSGQQLRNIKALSSADLDGYLSGKGMGFAKAAELNHYPGPKHVLELENELKLDQAQRLQTQALFSNMQKEAIKLGKQLVNKERELDVLFSSNAVSADNLKVLLAEIGVIRSSLRYVHLSTHLKQKDILSRHQNMQYDNLRGYSGGGKQHEHSH